MKTLFYILRMIGQQKGLTTDIDTLEQQDKMITCAKSEPHLLPLYITK